MSRKRKIPEDAVVICVDCGVENGCDCDTVIVEEENECIGCQQPESQCKCNYGALCDDCQQPVCMCSAPTFPTKRQKIDSREVDDDDNRSLEDDWEIEVGTCCFCGGDCNPCSQACGPCIRNGAMMMSYFESLNSGREIQRISKV